MRPFFRESHSRSDLDTVTDCDNQVSATVKDDPSGIQVTQRVSRYLGLTYGISIRMGNYLPGSVLSVSGPSMEKPFVVACRQEWRGCFSAEYDSLRG